MDFHVENLPCTVPVLRCSSLLILFMSLSPLQKNVFFSPSLFILPFTVVSLFSLIVLAISVQFQEHEVCAFPATFAQL